MTVAPSWDHFRTLLAVLEAGSLSGGARRLGLSQPTAGRHIEQLEQALGAALFTRSQTGLRPTDLALELRPHLAEFRDLYPEVAIELIVSNESQDLLRREADIAVRTFRPT
jgi:DNA-binding transcriptional LysR family regulator